MRECTVSLSFDAVHCGCGSRRCLPSLPCPCPYTLHIQIIFLFSLLYIWFISICAFLRMWNTICMSISYSILLHEAYVSPNDFVAFFGAIMIDEILNEIIIIYRNTYICYGHVIYLFCLLFKIILWYISASIYCRL